MNPRARASRRAVVSLLSLTIACGGAPVADSVEPRSSSGAAGGAPGTLRATSPGALNVVLRGAETLRRGLTRETFDPKALVEHLGRDPQRILDWVKGNTYWVPYRGALRGPVGVLLDRLGNSLDRSLLLAELLRETGQTVRLAQATLPLDRARQIVSRTDPPRDLRSLAPVKPQGEVDRDMDRIARTLGLAADVTRMEAQQRALATGRAMEEISMRLAPQTSFLARAVGRPASTQAEDARAVAGASDHWWVQRFEGNRWVDLDLLMSEMGPSTSPTPPDRIVTFDKPSGRLPTSDEDSHTVTIRMVIEQWTAGRLAEKIVLNHQFRAAEVLGSPISVTHHPTTMPPIETLLHGPDRVAALGAVLLQQTAWVPILSIGTQSIAQKGFNDAGDLVGLATPGAPAAGGRTSSSLGGVGDALGGEDPLPATQLTGEWIEYEIRVPGDRPRTIRREIFDLLRSARTIQPLAEPRIDDALRADRAFAVMGTIDILPLTAQMSRSYVHALTLADLLNNADALVKREAQLAAGDTAGAIESAARIRLHSDELLQLALGRFEWSPVQNDVFLETPNILSYRRTWLPKGSQLTLRAGFDIVANHVGVRAKSHLTPFATRVAQGVADTNTEALLIGGNLSDNAGATLARQSSSDQWIILRQGPALKSVPSEWSGELGRHIANVVKSGHTVVAPKGTNTRAFWAVDPETGDTIGVGDFGWGQASSEYVLVVAFATYAAFMLNLMVCDANTPGPTSLATCLSPAWVFVAIAIRLAQPPPPTPAPVNGQFNPPWMQRYGSGGDLQ